MPSSSVTTFSGLLTRPLALLCVGIGCRPGLRLRFKPSLRLRQPPPRLRVDGREVRIDLHERLDDHR